MQHVLFPEEVTAPSEPPHVPTHVHRLVTSEAISELHYQTELLNGHAAPRAVCTGMQYTNRLGGSTAL